MKKNLNIKATLTAIFGSALFVSSAFADCETRSSKIEYVGSVLFMAEPLNHLNVQQDRDAGFLKLESDEGDGFSLKIAAEKKEIEIIQDPIFGKISKTIQCSRAESREICGEYLAKASELIQRAQFQMSSQTERKEKMKSLECAQERVDYALQKIEEDPSRALSSL